jgi:chemotaxis response regulator CheB
MNAHPDIVAIDTSSGEVGALQALLEALSDLDAIVLVVLHRPANRISFLREILVRKSRMPVVIARHGELLHRGVCYIAEPSKHLMVGPGLRADLLPDHRYTTRNIDQLFISLARHYGARTIGVVLSGQLDDGNARASSAGDAAWGPADGAPLFDLAQCAASDPI